MIAMAFIAPVFFFIFYEEKSMDEFSYISFLNSISTTS